MCFFLKAVKTQAQENQRKAKEILALYETKKSKIVNLTRSQYAIYTLDFIFSRPIFKSSDFINCNEIPVATAKRILSVLKDNDIIHTLREGSGRRPAVYAFSELLEVSEGYSVL